MSTIITKEQKEILIVEFRDVRLIDEPRIQNLGSELLELVSNTKLNKVLLDFSNVKFMASSMIGKITMLRKKCIELKVDLRMCNLTENIQEVFSLMRLDGIFEIYSSQDEAFEAFETHKKKWYV